MHALSEANRLIIIAGPSGVGKTPLLHGFAKLYPDEYKLIRPVVLYSSRAPRPEETDGVDYHFVPEEKIRSLSREDHILTMQVRGHMQALDYKQLKKDLQQSTMIYEGNTFTALKIMEKAKKSGAETISIFISPLSKNEVRFFRSKGTKINFPALCTDIIRKKVARRTAKSNQFLTEPLLADIETRAATVYEEMELAHTFDFVIPNHDGEDSEHWDAFYFPVGEARLSVIALHRIIHGENDAFSEKWDASVSG